MLKDETQTSRDDSSDDTELSEEKKTEILDVRKLNLQLQFLAIDTQMIDRKIDFPCIETTISDFTEEIMTAATGDEIYFSEYLDEKNLRAGNEFIKRLR